MSKSCPVMGRYVRLQVAEGIMRFMMERIPQDKCNLEEMAM